MNIREFLEKARDRSRLTKKQVIDKRGRRTTVYVKPGGVVQDIWDIIYSFFGARRRAAKKAYIDSGAKAKGVSYDNFKKHFLVYFKGKDKWDRYFSTPEPRPKMIIKTKSGVIDAFSVLNEGVMQSLHERYKTLQRRAKDDTRNKTESGRKRIPANLPEDDSGRTEKVSGWDVPSRKPEYNSEQSVLYGGNIGERSSIDVRLTPAQVVNIRKTCLEILKKPDDQITEAEKDILRQYEGGGGVKDEAKTAAETLYAYYTPSLVVGKMWELAKKYLAGRNTVDVLEPAAGSGRFADYIPSGVNARMDMIEPDDVSYRINRILHPEANVKKGVFEEMFVQNRVVQKKYKGKKYDLIIGNPPYGLFTGEYKGLGEGMGHSRYEEYFIDRGLDTLKDGGLMAFIVPSEFMRSNKNIKIKERIAAKGKLLEAWRLPNGTFNTTGIGTDVLVIRKEKGDINPLLGDKYFQDNPENVLGVETTRTGRYGRMEKWVNPPDGVALMDVFNLLNANKYPVVPMGAKTLSEATKEKIAVAMEGNKNAEKPFKEPKAKTKGGRKKKEVVPEGVTKKETMDVAQFAAKYHRKISPVDSAVFKATDYDGSVNMSLLSENDAKKFMESGDYCQMGGRVYHRVNYASGNIYEKLARLEADRPVIGEEAYRRQKKILESVLPKKKTVKEITLSPLTEYAKKFRFPDGETLIEKFYEWAGVDKYNPRYPNFSGNISPHDLPPGIRWAQIIDYIEGKAVGVRTKPRATDEERLRIQEEAALVKDKRAEAAETLFKRFLETGLVGDDEEYFTDQYNRRFNSNVEPDYSKIPLFVEGISTSFKRDADGNPIPLNIRDVQLRGASFLCNKGNGILAYEVGLGKTMTGIIATVHQMQTGRAHKPLIIVPKAVYKNWIKEIKELFPNIKINELGNMSDSAVRQFKTPDGRLNIPPDAINICTYDALQNITFSEKTLDPLMDDLLDSQKRSTDGKKKTERQKAAEEQSIREKLGRASKTRGGSVYMIEDLGFDHLTIDEAHAFKNVFGQAKVPQSDTGQTVNEFSGLIGGTSDRALKMFALAQHIQRTNNDRNVFALTATPFTNSAIEIYNILSLVARKRLKELGIYNMHEFLAQFANIKTEWVIKTSGEIKKAPVLKSFKNLPLLQSLIREYIDKKGIAESGIARPKISRHFVHLPMTGKQRHLRDIEQLRFDHTSKEEPGATLKAINNMRMSLISMSLVTKDDHNDGVDFGGDAVEDSPKMKFVLDSTAKVYKEKPTTGQIIYAPRGIELYDDYIKALIGRGVPKDAIAVIHAGVPLSKREDIIENFNDPKGKIKILIGSDTIVEGVNLNGNTGVLYNTMLDWNPTQRVQLEGRLWRFGNKQKHVHVVYPLMADSVDSALNQKHDEKVSRIDDIFSYTGEKLEIGDIRPEELKFDLIKDPEKRAQYRIDLETEEMRNNIAKLRLAADLLRKQKHAYENAMETVKYANSRIASAEKEISDYTNSLKEYEKQLREAKDDNEVKRIQTYIERFKMFIQNERKTIAQSRADIRKAEAIRDDVVKRLQDMGNITIDGVEDKAKQIEKEAESINGNIDKIKEKLPQYTEEAREELKKKKMTVKPVEESVKETTSIILANLQSAADEMAKALVFVVGNTILKARVLTSTENDGVIDRIMHDGKEYIVKRGRK